MLFKGTTYAVTHHSSGKELRIATHYFFLPSTFFIGKIDIVAQNFQESGWFMHAFDDSTYLVYALLSRRIFVINLFPRIIVFVWRVGSAEPCVVVGSSTDT